VSLPPSIAPERLQIVLWKWRHPHRRDVIFRFTADWVNEMARMISANLRMPHDIVCITDDPSGLDSHIRTIPLWDDLRDLGGCMPRLRAFAPDMAQIIGPRFVWMDLDCLAVGDLTPLFDRPEEAVFYRTYELEWPTYNGSMVMMTAGARAQVWSDFDPLTSPDKVKKNAGTNSDQAWISYALGPDEAVWTRDDGVLLFRRDCPKVLSDMARLVYFAGPYKAHMKFVREQAPWIDGALANIPPTPTQTDH